MNLLRTLVTFQALILLACFAALAIDLYFIHLYIQHDNIIFIWRFYVQFGITAIWIVFFFTSLITVIIRHRRRRYEPSSPPDPFASTNPAEDGVSLLKLMAILLRPLCCLASAVAMLFITVQALIYSNRSVMALTTSRGSPQTDYSSFDPKNLLLCEYHASEDIEDDSVYPLCPWDRSATSLAIVASIFVVVEALLMFLYNNRATAARSKVDLQRTNLPYTEGKVLVP